eukprot:scaffold12879_cov50-Attheya_sp.AAC.4
MVFSRSRHLIVIFLVGLLLLSIIAPATSSDNDETCINSAENENNSTYSNKKDDAFPVCGMYIAESSIPNAGFGMYAGTPIAKGDYVGGDYLGDGALGGTGYELIIALHDAASTDEDGGDYYWDETLFRYPLMDTDYYSRFLEFGPANSHATLWNIAPTFTEFKRNSAGLHRYNDPGTGAISTLHGINWEATDDIEAGSELFCDVGPQYFKEREETIGYVPQEGDFQTVDEMMYEALEIIGDREISQEDWNDLIRSVETEHIRTLLPSNFQDLKRASEIGSAKFNLPNNIKTQEWLEENGWCVDNAVEPGLSKISQAGRGLFAMRFLKKGSTVVPVPLIIFGRKIMEMRDIDYNDEEDELVYADEIVGKQTLINYCYGHPQSSVLLVPNNSDALYINHDGNDPNTAIRWVEKGNIVPEDWLSQSVKTMIERGSGAMMEFYALRDIKPDEEITVNYGSEWEEAWAKHVENWAPEESEKDYISAADYLEAGLFTIRTEEEQEENPYPDNLGTACYYSPTYEYEVVDDVVQIDWNFSTEYGEDEEDYYAFPLCFYPCGIIGSEDLNGTHAHVAVLFNHFPVGVGDWDDQCWLPPNLDYIVTGIPSRAITLIDLPYTSDEHIPGAFRHEIGVPEGFFPPEWLDLT